MVTSYVDDNAGYFGADPSSFARLQRILGGLQRDTGYRVYYQTLPSGANKDGPLGLAALRAKWSVDDDTVVLTADRGIPGRLQAGGSLIRVDFLGDNVALKLPEMFWARLRREYGSFSFVDARGEATAIVRSAEVIITCLRNEEYCTTVERADASYF